MIRGPQDNRGWILPLCRIIRELGAMVTWDVGSFELLFPCGKVVRPTEEAGLKYVKADDLYWIRKSCSKVTLMEDQPR